MLGEGSTLAVPEGVGIGVAVIRERLAQAEARWREVDPYPAG